MEYFTLEASSAREIDEQLMAMHKDGWRPSGGLVVAADSGLKFSPQLKFFQRVERDISNKVEK